MNATLFLFLLASIFSIIGAIGVVISRNVVHGALFLVFSLLSIGGLFLLLMADFLFLVQLLLYGGAVTILLLFALMLTRAREEPLILDNPQRPLAAIVAILLLAILVFASFQTRWPLAVQDSLRRVEFGEIGKSLFTQWAVPFEIASVLLLIALIGAIVIARREEQE